MTVKIVAEAGINCSSSLSTAKRMADIAIECGADAVKFQTFSKDRFPAIEHLRMPWKKQKRLFWYCNEQGIKWFSTPFDFSAINFLIQMDMKTWKVPSGLITNTGYLKRIAVCRGKKILSTGMSNLDEVNVAIGYLGRSSLTLLHCTSLYPTPYDQVNLSAMFSLREQFGLPVGLSDHSQGIEVPIAAAAMGAEIIEKHFTFDRNATGPDHAASIEPHELKQMVRSIRNVEQAIGDGVKKCSKGERGMVKEIRTRMNN